MVLFLPLLASPRFLEAQAPACCTPPGFNLNCLGDLESFLNDAEMRVALCAAPQNDPNATFRFNFNSLQVNTPCVLIGPATIGDVCPSAPAIQNVNAPEGTRMLGLLSGGWNHLNKREGVAFPL
jgi:hypothetical protein